MRLAKINIRRRLPRPKTLTSKSPHKSQKNEVAEVVGAFWFLEEELSLDKAREMARRLEITGSEGVTFYGSSERIYKAKRRKQNTRVSGLQRNKFEAKAETADTGRSYGFPGDDDDDGASSNEDLSEILDYPHKPIAKNDITTNGTKPQMSSPISPPTSQDTQHDSSGNDTPTRSTFQQEESTPPMPGSFVFEEPPSSPAFSSTNTDNHFTINQALYGTPRRPNYTNPGIAIEPRYNARSPLPPPASRGDMTPRQLAVFARRKQEFERFSSTRSATPSLLNESFSDEYKPFSEREQAERRRRKKDLEKWREEKEALKRESERLLGGKAANKDGRGRERDTEDAEDVEMEDRPAKRSKSSNFFQSLLTEEEDDFNMSTAGSAFGNFGNKSTDGSRIHSPAASPNSEEGSDTEQETSVTTKVKNVLADNNQSKTSSSEPVINPPKSSFEVPTPSPSPSPPLQPVQTFSKSITAHIPKVPSRLRTQTTPSSPAGSPQKVADNSSRTIDKQTKKDVVSEAILALSSDKLMHFKFPPLGPQPRDFISSKIIMALTSR